MWKYWPFKKDYLVYAGAALLFFICYQLAISRTLEEVQLYRRLHAELEAGNDLGYQPGYLERQSGNLEKTLELYRSDTLQFRSNSLSKIAAMADQQHVKLTGVPAAEDVYRLDKAILQKLRFSGDFFSLNRFLYQLESTPGIGLPRSVIYQAERKGALPVPGKLVLEVLLEISR